MPLPFSQTWLLEHEHLQARHGALATSDEQPNPTALILNLAPVAVTSALSSIEVPSLWRALQLPL